MVKAFDWMDESCYRYTLSIFFRQLKVDAAERIAHRMANKSKLRKMLKIAFRLIHINRAAPVYRRTRQKWSCFRKYVSVAH